MEQHRKRSIGQESKENLLNNHRMKWNNTEKEALVRKARKHWRKWLNGKWLNGRIAR
jgi:hypothetical protein